MDQSDAERSIAIPCRRNNTRIGASDAHRYTASHLLAAGQHRSGSDARVRNHRRHHLRNRTNDGSGGLNMAQSLPPAAPIIGSLPPPVLDDGMPELSLPAQSPEATSILMSRESRQPTKPSVLAASAPARTFMDFAGRGRSRSSIEEPSVLSSSPTALSLLQNMRSSHESNRGPSKLASRVKFADMPDNSSFSRVDYTLSGVEQLKLDEGPVDHAGSLEEHSDDDVDNDDDTQLMFQAD